MTRKIPIQMGTYQKGDCIQAIDPPYGSHKCIISDDEIAVFSPVCRAVDGCIKADYEKLFALDNTGTVEAAYTKTYIELVK